VLPIKADVEASFLRDSPFATHAAQILEPSKPTQGLSFCEPGKLAALSVQNALSIKADVGA
jgi:hypothetical protein